MTMSRMLRAALAMLCLMSGMAAHAVPTLSVAIVPQFPLEQISTAWTPVLERITRSTGIRFKLKAYDTIPHFEAGFLRGEVDVAYMNPYHAVMAHKAAGYIPVIRDSQQRLTGLLVVRKDSPIRQLADLNGATIAFPAPNAFGASLYMRALLTEREGIHFKSVYVKTHTNVYRHVLIGRAKAGGAVRNTLEREPAEVRDQLRVLYETPAVLPHPVVVHPRVPVQVRLALQAAFLELAGRKDAKAMLAGIQIPAPTRATYADYASLEQLNLERYVVLKED